MKSSCIIYAYLGKPPRLRPGFPFGFHPFAASEITVQDRRIPHEDRFPLLRALGRPRRDSELRQPARAGRRFLELHVDRRHRLRPHDVPAHRAHVRGLLQRAPLRPLRRRPDLGGCKGVLRAPGRISGLHHLLCGTEYRQSAAQQRNPQQLLAGRLQQWLMEVGQRRNLFLYQLVQVSAGQFHRYRKPAPCVSRNQSQ